MDPQPTTPIFLISIRILLSSALFPYLPLKTLFLFSRKAFFPFLMVLGLGKVGIQGEFKPLPIFQGHFAAPNHGPYPIHPQIELLLSSGAAVRQMRPSRFSSGYPEGTWPRFQGRSGAYPLYPER